MRLAHVIVLLLSLTVSSCSSSPTAATPTATVNPSISFAGGSVFAVGQTSQLSATELMSSQTTADVTKTATWQSSNPVVATVSSTGFVTALALGSTIITANNQGTVGSLVVSVVGNTVVSLLVVGPTSFPTGQTGQLTAVALMTTGVSQTLTDGVAWHSSNSGVATVSSAGFLTTGAAGTATITATYAGKTGTLAVTVVNETVTSIVFYGTTSIASGVTSQLTASATFADGSAQIVTNVATWQSSDSTVVTVSSVGLVTWIAKGTATITATYLGTSGSVGITAN
jgi:trimeric autotransporter adhesin